MILEGLDPKMVDYTLIKVETSISDHVLKAIE